ncbi:agamous-like MADS-box protein AGL82, partial [Benincasa hispida]|uniref:agamous-like MADS-box protein AGL82 n=1 Tax=Benincasa hispida TaxID=102211 RepID=UPI0019020B5B
MGRGKLSLNLIPNRKSRISTFKKRKNSLMKKAYELSTLCDVQTCVLVHGPASLPTEDPSQSDPEFHTWPSDRTHLEAMIRAYKTTRSCNFQKCKCFGLTDYFSDRKRKIESETCKLREKFMCPKWDEWLDRLSEHELREFMEGLDAKIEAANGMIDFMELADHENLFGELCSENSVQMGEDSIPQVLIPSVDDLFATGANHTEEDVMALDAVSYTHLDVYKRQE